MAEEVKKEVKIYTKKVHSQKKVTIIGTEKSKYMKTGKEYLVTETAAKELVATGHAIYKKNKE